jgi:putative tryptophan/tyrosine transport system substrate-binding protein
MRYDMMPIQSLEGWAMKRRDFIKAVGGAAIAWPLAANAQQPAMPVVGFLQPGSPADSGHFAAAFLNGLREIGYVEGDNLRVEYRWAEGQYERFPKLSEDLVKREVTVIAAGGPPATLAAKSATSTIPIVFIGSDDPVKEGVVASLNRPGGNVTGVTVFTTAAMWSKRLELLHDLVPKVASVAILLNPNDTANWDTNEMMPAARALGVQLVSLTATTDADIEAAFSAAAERRIEALLVSDKPFFTVRHKQIVALAAHHALPAVYGWREHVAAGGLMSYGSSLTDAWHQVGLYTGRILKGAKPSDLPVVRPTRFELVINLKTAKALGLDVPAKLLALADEVIE